jgi:ElaB/YqjD/DUF883 family membrane-anchored ribosome-binding protein
MGPEQNLMTNDELKKQEPRSSTEIESDIEKTRGRMDATLDQLSDRLTLRSLLNSALDWWESRGTGAPGGGPTKEAYQSVARFMKQNPMPSALVGAGVIWMILDAMASDEETGSYPRSVSYGGTRSGGAPTSYNPPSTEEAIEGASGIVESAKGKLEHAKDAVAEAAGAAKEKVASWSTVASERAEDFGRRTHEVYDQGRSTALKVSENIQRGYQTGTEQFQNAMQEYPLAVGIGFAAFGMLVGVLLPRTRREDELLGKRSDQLVEAAKEKGKELLERGKDVAERVAETALDEARQQGLTPEAASGAISGIAEKVGEVARKAKQEAGTAVKESKLTPEQLKREASSAAAGTKQERKAGAQRKSDEQG